MNKRLLVGMFAALMAMVPLSGYADQTIDAPHVNVDSNGGTEDCTYCHFANYQPSDCVRCHSNNNAPYGDSTAPLVSTHQNLNCQACHNPHVSLQAQGITGAYTGISADTPSAGMTTLTGVTPAPEVLWAEKTGPGRGMILWVANGTDGQGNPQSASFEVTAIDAGAGTVTVKGAVPVASGNFDLRRGQLIAKKVTKTAASSYRQGDIPVEFPSQGSTSIFIDTVNATPTGVCQVCHTNTHYWKNDGTLATHNANLPCTQCHKHSSGFMVTGCTACHPGPEPDGPPTVFPDQMASPSTGSMTAGQHALHATTAGYNFPCGTCHYGTGMDRINAPTNIVKNDGIQIGFSWGGFMGYLTSYNGQASVTVPYVGTNNTTVTKTGTVGNADLTCSNVYCHSDGTALRRGCATSTLNTSLSWDGNSVDPQGDTVTCNNCHGYLNGKANVITSGKHLTHVKNLSMPCFYCHADTVANDGSGGVVLSNKTNHVNAAYDVKGGGDWYGTPIVLDKNIASGTGTWNPTTKNCTVLCHNYSRNWTKTDTGTCPDVCSGGAVLNDDPVSVSFKAEQISRNTVRFTSVATDKDRSDPVKAQCRGGGHDGSSGQLRIQRTSGGKLVAVPKFDGQPMINDWVLSDPSQIDSSNPSQPVFWYHRVYIDNDPASLNNLDPLKTYKNSSLAPNDGLIYGDTDGVAWSNAFQSIPWDPNFDETQVNVLATPAVTTSVENLGGGSYRLTLTSNIVDPDAIDSTKNDYFGGHGHDGTVKVRVKAYWGGGTTFTVHRALPTDNTTPLTMETPMSYTFTGKTSGSQLWYYVQVFDSHREDPTANAAAPSPAGESGWTFVIAP